jgi:hypothetical protein
MTRKRAAGSANQATMRIAAWVAPTLVSVVLLALLAHVGPAELALLAGASALCYFEVVFALRFAPAHRRANLHSRAARGALDQVRYTPPELSRQIFRAAPYLRRAYPPRRPVVGRNSNGLDAEAAPLCGSAFA